MAEDDSAMTSAKMLLRITQVEGNQDLEGSAGLEENGALEGILSLYPADFQLTTGSGATPIGSAGRAPDKFDESELEPGDSSLSRVMLCCSSS